MSIEEIRSVFEVLEEAGSDVSQADILRVAELTQAEAEVEDKASTNWTVWHFPRVTSQNIQYL